MAASLWGKVYGPGSPVVSAQPLNMVSPAAKYGLT